MAENKKSFLLYADYIHTVRKMPKDKAGELFVTILSYVNDENPEVTDPVIDLVFEPIKQQLKRDLKAWESEKTQRSSAGKKGMEKRWKGHKKEEKITKDNAVMSVITDYNELYQGITNITDNVNVNVNVNVNDIYIQLTSEQIWLEQVCMMARSNSESVKNHINTFLIEQAPKGELSKPLQEIKKHFVNWVKHNPVPKEESENKTTISFMTKHGKKE